MRQALLAIVFLGLAANFGLVQAADAPAKKQGPGAANQAGLKQSYLGVGIELLPAALASQMSAIVPKGQGLLVTRVDPHSPAATAALQPYDVLLRYGDQKLHSPEQLVTLVRDDKPGQEVTLGFVRGGKSETCKVTLGERESPDVSDNPRIFRLLPDEQLRQVFEESERKNDNSAWELFDALKLTRLDGKRWRAEIDFRSKEGKKDHKTFEGTREEIRKSVQADKDLPANERTHLLRALNLHDPVFEFHFPPFGPMSPSFREQP